MKRLILVMACLVLGVRTAGATAEICGNDIDDDGNGMVDEGCAPTITTGVCESPLSCGTTGMVSWKTGALHYDLPADLSPKVPYGPGIGLRRFYTSTYAPGFGPVSVNHNPLGARWQHTYMSWIDKSGSGAGSNVILHTSEGRDVFATYASSAGGWDSYAPQAGFHVMSIKYNTVSPNQYQVQLLTGETLYFNSVGQLTQLWDTLPTPNKVLITWTSPSAGNVSTVTDAAGERQLLFNYTSNLLTSVSYQLKIAGTWTTQHTTTYGYISGTLMSATIGASLSQQYAYTGGFLSSITDATGILIASFNYNATTSGQVNGVTTPNGNVGFDFASSRTACSGNTVLYFNKQSTGACSVDSDCGTGFCGGTTGAGATGRCFTATRCMTLGTVNGESVVTTIVPLATPPSGTQCTGACAEVAQYVWSATAGLLNVTGTKDPLGNYTSVVYNANGLPTQIAYADTDSDPTNGGYVRTTYITYDATFPGRVSETRRLSDLAPVGSSSCVPGGPVTYCARESYGFGTDNQLITLQHSGLTISSSNSNVSFSYTTTYAHDALGRLIEIDGPATGMKTTFDFFSSTDPKLDGFLQHAKSYKDGTNHLDTTILAYDFWGNVTGRTDPDGTVSCRTFDSSRNYLAQTREAMAGQLDCTTTNGADIITASVLDSALRLSQRTRPDGSCIFYLYNTSGQLSTIKRRDDCNASSSGDYETYVYTTDGLVSEVDTYDSSGTLKRRSAQTFYQSRRLQSVVNPVNSTYKQAIYDARGVMNEVDDEISGGAPLGKTLYTVDADHRMTSETRYKTGSTFDTWTFLYDWLGDQSKYTDGDSKSVQSVRDDLGRYVKMISPDRSYPTLKIYDAANRMVETNEAFGVAGAGPGYDHTFTYDYLGRRLNDNYAGTCATGTAQPEIQRAYDSMPSGVTCPISGGCTNISGRLAYVKAQLVCSSAYSTTDGSLDQETFYAYDATGRIVDEYVRDDGGRVADHKYTWTKNGALTQFITPAGATMSWSYGSSGSNSDTDLVTSIAQSSTTILSSISWFPFGPLAGYKQAATIGGLPLSTVISRNLAYRVSDTRMTNGTTEYEGVNIAEDSKGRVLKRDYFDNSAGVQDSYFIYDSQDRILCETTVFASACPAPGTSFATVKNDHVVASPYFTNAGDWNGIARLDRGAIHTDTVSLTAGTHQISQVAQDGTLGQVTYSYNVLGDRVSDAASASDETHTGRTYTYDGRHNLTNVRMQYIASRTCTFGCVNTWHYFDLGSTYDARGRRVSKTFYEETTGDTSTLFFYYDAKDQLTEINYTPHVTSPSTHSVYQIAWLVGSPVLHTQTDYPANAVSRRYAIGDEAGRTYALWSWPVTGDATRVWSIDPSAWAYDIPPLTGGGILQPFSFAGQYVDWETYTTADDTSKHEPALSLNGHRQYDPFAGGYLQLDALVDQTRTGYVYAESNPVGKRDRLGLMINECTDKCDTRPDDLYAACIASCEGAGGDGGGAFGGADAGGFDAGGGGGTNNGTSTCDDLGGGYLPGGGGLNVGECYAPDGPWGGYQDEPCYNCSESAGPWFNPFGDGPFNPNDVPGGEAGEGGPKDSVSVSDSELAGACAEDCTQSMAAFSRLHNCGLRFFDRDCIDVVGNQFEDEQSRFFQECFTKCVHTGNSMPMPIVDHWF